ncbi:TonB-dependent receptor [Sphingobacterium faecale]|uniref:TonB-dependent receptor n=1 Tax=Sphingobacterium faecale TaxID=2803775 RepID=A0ABS1R220_9SPHI|nr:TonB-dependent receptor [Sphingobacterium faecale]MBL1408097.1 TonB-dependent receptor [Sphingobacterium faecale]
MKYINCKIRVILLVYCALCFGAKEVFAQGGEVLKGLVTDENGSPVVGANVYLVGQKRSEQTDKDGLFHFVDEGGKHRVHISKVGYGKQSYTEVFGQQICPVFQLVSESVGLHEIVVTATRTEKRLADIPLPVSVVGAKEMQDKGMVRLNEVLAEQPGIALVENHGTGVQLQGFDAKYTLILIDGEPVIGRSSGTLELSRITLANVERIEILKGPSSSLYGSEAMAGVINVITKKALLGKKLGASMRYGTHQALDIGVDGSIAGRKTGVYGAFNRFSNNGYGYSDGAVGKTVPPFYGHTGHVKVNHQMTPKMELQLGLNYNDEYAKDQYETNIAVTKEMVSSKFLRRDFTLTPRLEYRFSDRHTSFLRVNQSFYKTDTRIHVLEDGHLYNHDFFDQKFSRAELQHNFQVNDQISLTGGVGTTDEWLKANRYDDKKEFRAGFGYVQADIRFSDRLNVIGGGRFDVHSVYASQFSPKLAAQYKALSWLTVNGSVGSAYKAPDFRELYLNWTNPTQGYSVFGAEDAAYKLDRLLAAGEISEVLFDAENIKPLDAERSWNYQGGVRLHPWEKLTVGVNAFYNEVSNLIETFVLATKTNGKSVYTYSNQEHVVIKGIESNVTYEWQDFRLQVGGQYLRTANTTVQDAITAGKGYYTRDAEIGASRLVKPNEYGGLFNRSRYSGTMSLTYICPKPKLTCTFRWSYRGRFGVRDIDGNGILNLDEEYASGYSLLNASVVKSLYKERIALTLSGENLGNVKHTGVATMPGRLFFTGISYRITK